MTKPTPDPREGWIDTKTATPPIPAPYWFGKLSAPCEVTDGERVGRAHYREADNLLPDEGDELWHMSGWTDDIGEELDWSPTHWRPVAE